MCVFFLILKFIALYPELFCSLKLLILIFVQIQKDDDPPEAKEDEEIVRAFVVDKVCLAFLIDYRECSSFTEKNELHLHSCIKTSPLKLICH